MGDLQITKIPIVLMTLLLCSAYGNLYHDFIDEITANGASSNQRPLWLELGSQLKSLGKQSHHFLSLMNQNLKILVPSLVFNNDKYENKF